MLPWILLARKSKSSRDTCFNLRAPVVSLQLLCLPTEAVVRNKQQLDWFLKTESQVSSTFHFSVLFQQVALGKGGKKCWGILQIVFIQHL